MNEHGNERKNVYVDDEIVKGHIEADTMETESEMEKRG